jgi:hypothetical protein
MSTVITGIPGVGKSTLGKLLGSYLHIEVRRISDLSLDCDGTLFEGYSPSLIPKVPVGYIVLLPSRYYLKVLEDLLSKEDTPYREFLLSQKVNHQRGVTHSFGFPPSSFFKGIFRNPDAAVTYVKVGSCKYLI